MNEQINTNIKILIIIRFTCAGENREITSHQNNWPGELNSVNFILNIDKYLLNCRPECEIMIYISPNWLNYGTKELENDADVQL